MQLKGMKKNMSFDLILFDNTIAPKEKVQFINWTEEIMSWREDIDYNNPNNLVNPDLKSCFEELITLYPPLNGSLSPSDEEWDNAKWCEKWENKCTDYSIDKYLIYAAFAWSESNEAERTLKQLSKKYKIGYYGISTSGEIILNLNSTQYFLETESEQIEIFSFDKIEKSVFSLDSITRGHSNREGAYIQVWYTENQIKNDKLVQVAPNYEKKTFKDFFKKTENTNKIDSYQMEVFLEDNIYQKTIFSKEEIITIFYDFYINQKLPKSVLDWEKYIF